MSKIEWTDETWNPVTGCTKVSAGCKNCYAEGVAARFWKDRKFTDVRTHDDRLDAPLRWRKPRRVFVNSMSDLFHEDVPDAFIDRVFAVMALAPKHTFQVLTKRPMRMEVYLHRLEGYGLGLDGKARDRGSKMFANVERPWPLPNIWLGVSCEDQRAADERIPLLMKTPAAVRFLSCEPLIGPIDLRRTQDARDCPHGRGVDWVIVGGESGPGARSCSIEWIRDIVRQCGYASVPVFVKQIGRYPCTEIRQAGFMSNPDGTIARQYPSWSRINADGSILTIRDRKGADMSAWPEDIRVREFPKVEAAR